jgi:RimJ/RimL family protein N-acetyltransferase
MPAVLSTSDIELVAIGIDGKPDKELGLLPPVAADVMAGLASMYKTLGFSPPWIGYLAVQNERVVGTCAFKGAPVAGKAEIAYFTFPGHEGRGVAQTMAKMLMGLARRAESSIQITAQTLPTPNASNASNALLRKLGFSFAGSVMSAEDGEVWEWQHRDACT